MIYKKFINHLPRNFITPYVACPICLSQYPFPPLFVLCYFFVALTLENTTNYNYGTIVRYLAACLIAE